MRWDAQEQESLAIEDLINQGWKRLNYISEYLTKYNEKQIIRVYLIRPEVYIPYEDGEFQEKHGSAEDAEFETWIETIGENNYVQF